MNKKIIYEICYFCFKRTRSPNYKYYCENCYHSKFVDFGYIGPDAIKEAVKRLKEANMLIPKILVPKTHKGSDDDNDISNEYELEEKT